MLLAASTIRGPWTQPRLIASRGAVVAEVADRGKAGTQRLHPVHLRFKRIHLRLFAHVGDKARLAAPVRREMDMTVDQPGKDGPG